MSPLTFEDVDELPWELFDEMMLVDQVESEVRQSNKDIAKATKGLNR